MTRINVIPPEDLSSPHLVAEYRELPRTFALAYQASLRGDLWSPKTPKDYTLGKGHVLFFYDKLLYLSKRHQLLVKEMLRRKYKPNFTEDLFLVWKSKIPAEYWGNYRPTKKAIAINLDRINKRLAGDRS